ncbi:hypothetical protein LTR27_011213 [Elasticomyces elasticus]|nr:hypothetical protein LTR27_011213 [Elasticomyces elasticus]
MAPSPPAPTLSPHAIRALRDTLVRLTIPVQIHDRATFRDLTLRHVATLVHPEMLVPGLVADTANQLGGEMADTFLNLYGERLWPGQVVADPHGTVRRYALGPDLAEYFTALLQLPVVLVESAEELVTRLTRSRMTGMQVEVQDDDEGWDTDSADEGDKEGEGKVRTTPTKKVTPAANGSQGGSKRDELICGSPLGVDEAGKDLECEERFQSQAALEEHRREEHWYT